MLGLARENAVEIRQRRLEVVPALGQRGTQEEHGHRRLLEVPPGRQRGFGVAIVARIGARAAELGVGGGEPDGGGQIRGVGGMAGALRTERIVLRRIGGKGFDHDVVALGHERLGRERRGLRKHQRGQPQGAGSMGCAHGCGPSESRAPEGTRLRRRAQWWPWLRPFSGVAA
jgi:hypothetical protein